MDMIFTITTIATTVVVIITVFTASTSIAIKARTDVRASTSDCQLSALAPPQGSNSSSFASRHGRSRLHTL